MKPVCPATAHRQAGAALLVALMILVLTAVLGVAAMKSSMFSSRIATGTQIDAMAFEAAETAVSQAFGEIAQPANISTLVSIVDGGTYQRCITKTDALKDGACGSSDALDFRGLVKSSAEATLRGRRPISGSQVSVSGAGSIIVDYEVGILGHGEVQSHGVENFHAQEALQRGVMAGAEIE